MREQRLVAFKETLLRGWSVLKVGKDTMKGGGMQGMGEISKAEGPDCLVGY